MEDPQIAALIRAIESFRADVKDDFALVRDDLRGYLPREVYTNDKEALDKRISVLERAREAARNALYTAVASIAVSVVLFISSIKGGA